MFILKQPNISGVFTGNTTGQGRGQQLPFITSTLLKKTKMPQCWLVSIQLRLELNSNFSQDSISLLCAGSFITPITWNTIHAYNTELGMIAGYSRPFLWTHRSTVLHGSRKPTRLKECHWASVTKKGSSNKSARFYFAHIFDNPNFQTVWKSWNR